MQNLSSLLATLPPADSPNATESVRDIHQCYKDVCQSAGALATALSSERPPDGDVAQSLGECVKKTKSLISSAMQARNQVFFREDFTFENFVEI